MIGILLALKLVHGAPVSSRSRLTRQPKGGLIRAATSGHRLRRARPTGLRAKL